MKTISNNFREALRGIRQLNALITYQSESTSYILTTEDSRELQTELGKFLGTELGDIVVNAEAINRVNPLFKTELFRTICNSVEIDSKDEIPVNTWVNVKIGVLVNGSYEYLDFGDYYVTESKYNADTRSYLITAYDKMIEAMIPYDLEITYPVTIKGLILAIFNRLDWDFEIGTFVNQDKVLDKDLFTGQNLTFRDVLDDVCGVIVGNIGFDKKVAKIKYINELDNSTKLPFEIPQDLDEPIINNDRIITEEDLKNINVTIDKKYGPVNSIIVSSNDVVLNNLEDSVLIEANGKTEYNFKDNRILIYDADNYLAEMFQRIKGLEYYLYDFDTIGKLCYDLLDKVIVKIGDNQYPTLILNDDIKLTTGLVETMYVDEPEETTQEYISNDINERKINDALIKIDKANAEIDLKVSKDNLISEINLSPEEIVLTGNRLVVDSTNFKLNANGDATFSGNLNTSQDCVVGNNLYVGQNQSSSVIDNKYIYFNENNFIRRVYSSSVLNFTEMVSNQVSRIRSGDNKIEAYNDDYVSMKTASGGQFSISGTGLHASSSIIVDSDRRLKEDIKDIDVDWIDNLEIKEYKYKTAPNTKQIGIIAQDYIDKNGSEYYLRDYMNGDEKFYGVAYGNITTALVKYCQELKKEINDLKEEIKSLKGDDL